MVHPTASHGAPACNYSLLSASDDGTSGQGQWTPAVPSIYTAMMPRVHIPPTRQHGGALEPQHELLIGGRLLSTGLLTRLYSKLEAVPVGIELLLSVVAAFYKTGIPSQSRRRLRAGWRLKHAPARTSSHQHAPIILVILDGVWLPAGNKEGSPLRRDTGAGPDPKCPRSTNPMEALCVPDSSLPLPLKQILDWLSGQSPPPNERVGKKKV